MAKKTTLNPLTDTPQTLNDLTKDYMLKYVKTVGTEEDRKWFKALIKNNTFEDTNALNGKTCKKLKIKEIRRNFAERFFPNLLKRGKGTSFFDEVDGL